MGTRLEHVIARNVAERRTDRGWTQADLAREMHTWGFTWATNRVAQVETLRRPVSLLEVIGLAMVFDLPVQRLLDGDDQIALPDGREFPLAWLRKAVIEGQPKTRFSIFSPQYHLAVEAEYQDLRRMATKLGLSAPEDLDALARTLFGQAFHSEREARLGDVSGLSKRSAQTKRGHVSRALLAEVDEYLGEGPERSGRLTALHTPKGRES
jgi:transcriptional regulator with XRE-family HTH domain